LTNSHLASLLGGCFGFELHDELHKPHASVGQGCFHWHSMTAKASRSPIECAGLFLIEIATCLERRQFKLPFRQTKKQPLWPMKTTGCDFNWIAFVQFEAALRERFNALIDLEEQDAVPTYPEAWVNVLVEASAL